jgi:hypothetical protein
VSVEEGLGNVAAACGALELASSSYYRSGRSSLGSRRIRKEVLEFSEKHPRYGYRPLPRCCGGKASRSTQTRGPDSQRRGN